MKRLFFIYNYSGHPEELATRDLLNEALLMSAAPRRSLASLGMTRRIITFIVMMMFINNSIFALEKPAASRFDSRIQHINYNEDNIVEINAYPGTSTHIRFAEDEDILDVASGFSDGWEFVPRRNNLYLKPKSIKGKNDALLEPIAGKWDTDLHITTNLRIYTFQLVLHTSNSDNTSEVNQKVAYLVKFRYPQQEAAKLKMVAQQLAMEKQLARSPQPHNWNYSMQVGKNSRDIAPSMAYDDGRFTYIKFPGNQEFPAVFIVEVDEKESLVNNHIDPKAPDILVVHRVAREMVLRLGNQVVNIFNSNYDAHGIPAINGTTVTGTKRSIRWKEGVEL